MEQSMKQLWSDIYCSLPFKTVELLWWRIPTVWAMFHYSYHHLGWRIAAWTMTVVLLAFPIFAILFLISIEPWIYKKITFPIMCKFDPEDCHHASITALKILGGS